jgi:hypothetical protein
MLMFGEYQSIMIFFKGQSKWHITKKKLNFGMCLLLINIELQEGMVIKGI